MQKTKLMMAVGTTALALSVCLYTGCRKDDDKTTVTTTSEDTGYATDQNLAEKMFDDVQVVADKGSTTTGSGEFKTSGCGTVTHSGTTYTINFGETNCLCADNRYRRGKVIVNYTGAYADSGSSHTITFDNYYQNDNKIEGTKTVTNMGKNSLGQPWFNINVDGNITKPDGKSMTTKWNRVRTWTEGYTTKLIWKDDVYQITGSGTINRQGGLVTVNIPTSTPLIVSLDCRWIEAGSITYNLPSGFTRTLNYGDSPNCDNLAKLTLSNGIVKDITLP